MAAAGGTAGSAGNAAGAGGSAAGSGGSSGASGGSGGSAGAATDLYVGPKGNDQNPGTRDLPLLTLTKAHEYARAGMTIWVLAGTISYGQSALLIRNGSPGSPIKVWADSATRPVLDFSMLPRNDSNARGIEIRGNYWHIRGLEIQDAGDNGISISGSNNIVENMVMHHNGDTGIQITVRRRRRRPRRHSAA